MSFGHNLRERIKHKGITYAEMAKRVECHPSLITQYIQGLKRPSLPTLQRLAYFLECTIDDLVSDTEMPESCQATRDPDRSSPEAHPAPEAVSPETSGPERESQAALTAEGSRQ